MEPENATLMSVQRPGARVSLHFRHGEVDVMVAEVAGQASLSESPLWGIYSWHLVLEGKAIFQQGDQEWEVLSGHSLHLGSPPPYTIVNRSMGRLKVLSVVATGATPEVL